jgi:hypothetical protein
MKHWEYHPEPVDTCFGCKALGLQMNAGDANSNLRVSTRKWDKELEAYRSARAQGIQPAGTSMKKVNEAVQISEQAGKAFDASTRSFKG